ncbi:MAG: DNA ligase D [Phenylobacterium sp.]|uniref:DNA ligase D n=1 Tax=Phenylobacterium sp. TaxID=1871053 RepID=UPI001A45D110|nr:DNA ligase D [Phenylobacterium sp.]MBL8772665.1 DNA ligase D [Phenylobacterium sp.]
MADRLDSYRAKRRFSATPEPAGGPGGGASDAPIFVIQKHKARRLHYDLRLEMGGVLKSWAVPEGPCLDTKVRRFAKLTEDHPLEYGSFEGRIPEGNYGAGNVIIWDRGTYVTLKDPEQGLADGEIKFRLLGEKLSGGWTLVRLKGDGTDWLLIKERDPSARPIEDYDVLVEAPDSVVSGRSVDEPEPAPKPRRTVRKAAPGRIEGSVAASLPAKWKPQLATPADAAPKGPGWIHEIKYDGYRTLVFVDHGQVRMITRNGVDWTHRYAAVAKAFERLPCRTAILDGELVVQDPRGVARLDLLEQALSAGDSHAMTYFAFDLVHLDGYDLSGAKLIDRKRALEGLLAPVADPRSQIQISDHFEGEGDQLFAEASRLGLEGIVSKRADSRYVQQRSANWLKVKRVEIDEFVVIGFLSNMPKNASSLVLAEDRGGELEYACRVGSGIGEDLAREIYRALEPHLRAKPVVPVPPTPGARWVDPAWKVEVGYRSRSRIGAPRAPTLISIAPWKPQPAARAVKPRLVSDRDLAAIHLTNPQRAFSDTGVTKLDVAIYYARVGDWLLPEVLRRPVTVIRCPSGDLSELFYQRHAFNGLPPGLETVELSDEEGRAAFIAITEPRGYLGLTQFGAVEFHLWGCRIDDPEHPDRIVLDLDPDESVPWSRVCDGAEVLRDRLQALGLTPFLRTTGGKGLHLVVALTPGRHDWATVKGFSEAVARAAAADSPSLFTAVSGKERRKGKIFVDYIRNARGASAVASYSLRARPGFPVATPIAWDELRKLSGGHTFDRLSVVRRLETLAADPWDGLVSSSSDLTTKMLRDVGMKR